MTPEKKEFLLVATTAALSVINPVMGAVASTTLWVWQKGQVKQFERLLEEKLQRIDQNKLDKSALESNELKSLMLQAVETASQTASNLKLEALANALVNSVVLPTSQLTGKQALLRVVSQMSNEEMIALTALYYHKPTNENKYSFLDDLANDLFQEQGWDQEEVLVAYEGLKQLGLAGNFGLSNNPEKGGGRWEITALGRRLIQWCAP